VASTHVLLLPLLADDVHIVATGIPTRHTLGKLGSSLVAEMREVVECLILMPTSVPFNDHTSPLNTPANWEKRKKLSKIPITPS